MRGLVSGLTFAHWSSRLHNLSVRALQHLTNRGAR